MHACSLRRLTIPVALILSMSLAAPVSASGAGFDIQVQPTASVAAGNTTVQITATVRCTWPTGGLSSDEADYSGFGGSVTQTQGKTDVLGNVGAWAGLLPCDGTWQPMTGFSIPTGNGHWKAGAASLHVFAQFTDAVSHDVFRFDGDYSITIKVGNAHR